MPELVVKNSERILIYTSFCLLFCFSCGKQESEDRDIIALKKACDYLWTQQAEDGGWHSQTHGLLKKGKVLSPFIMQALLDVPESIYPKNQDQILKGLEFIRKSICLNCQNQIVLEYPNYATAYSLKLLKKWGDANDQMLIQDMSSYLLAQQFDEARDIDSLHPAYGGWGFGETNLVQGEVGHVDLSHTRRVLEALSLVNSLDDSVKNKARRFLDLCQKKRLVSYKAGKLKVIDESDFDGGFFYSPIVIAANKAGIISNPKDTIIRPRTYASSTCDGILGCLAIGMNPDSEDILASKKWLLAHDSWDFPTGIPKEATSQWHTALVLYHIMVKSEAYSALSIQSDWQKKMFEILSQYQSEDGSFANPQGARNKENDPLIGTTFAIIALLRALQT